MIAWTMAAVVVLLVCWGFCAVIYHWVHRRWLRWWAIPFAQGALIFRRRLERWEA